MRIKMRSLLAGPNGVRHVDQICEVSAIEGEALLAGGFAEELPEIAGGMTPEIAAKIQELEASTPSDSEFTNDAESAIEKQDPKASKKKRG